MDYSAARERVKRKIEEKCLLTGLDVPGRGGVRNSWMFYMRPGLFDPHFMEDVGQMFLRRCREEIGDLDFQICGLETGAVPLVVGLPMVAAREGVDINAFSVRKEPKAYGLVNYPPPKGSGLVNRRSLLHSVYYKPIDTWLVPQQLAVEEAT